MGEIKLSMTHPVRKARQGEQYLLYNTREFLCIYLDSVAYKAWTFIEKEKEFFLKQLVDFMITSDVSRETNEQLLSDCYNLIDFLSDKGFIERT